MAVLGPGGKGECAFELGVDEGIELLAHLYNCIDFHRIDSVAKAAFEVYLNLTFFQFVAVGKLAEFAKEKISTWLAGRKEYDKDLKRTKQAIYANLNDKRRLLKSPPEALGELLQLIVEVPEKEDFSAILRVLQSAEGRNDKAHKLKWIIRCFHDPELSRKLAGKDEKTKERMKKAALEEGIEELMSFGKDVSALTQMQADFQDDLRLLLQRNGVKYD